jgi:hypothetical protein
MGGAVMGRRTSSKPNLLPTVEVDTPVASPEPIKWGLYRLWVFQSEWDQDGLTKQLPLVPMPSSLDVREIMADRALSPPVQELRSPYANPQEYPWALPIGVPLNATNYSHVLHTPRNVEQEQTQTQTSSFNASPEQGVTVEDHLWFSTVVPGRMDGRIRSRLFERARTRTV